VQVLADDVSDARLPTRSAIPLDGLAARAKAGDFIFLYFAGHGSQIVKESGPKWGSRR